MNIEKKPLLIKAYHQWNENLLEAISGLDQEIFSKPYSKEKLLSDSGGKKDLLILIAYYGDEAVAFKVGYQGQADYFYSWIGGVSPSYRGQGIASLLMEKQHQLLQEMGYKKVQTKTQNRFKDMLILNLKMGFEITETYTSSENNQLRIVLEKNL